MFSRDKYRRKKKEQGEENQEECLRGSCSFVVVVNDLFIYFREKERMSRRREGERNLKQTPR